MNVKTFRYFVVFLTLVTSLFLLEAQAGKPDKVTVTSAFPDSAIQGDMTEVEIDGTGFDAGSTARFIVTDTRDDTQIDVNEVTFDVVTKKLKAKIKVKDAALPVEYDIEVTTSSGRRGKGTTLFRVREKAGEEDPCVAKTSYFPAFAYCVMYDTGQDLGFDIFLANADGDCTVQIYSADDSFRCDISFRYFENGSDSGTGKIVWSLHHDGPDTSSLPVIRMLEFNVVNQEVVESLPLNSNVIYTGPYTFPVGTSYDAELSPKGDSVMFHEYDNQDTGFDTYYLNELDISDCTGPDCVTRLMQFGHDTHYAAYSEYSLAHERIYFLLSNFDLDFTRRFAYVDKVGESWSEPTIIQSYDENVVALDVGLWDWDDDGFAEEVVSVAIDQGRTEYVQIWGCLSPGENPCLVLDSIEGRKGSFKSIDGIPAFLHLSRGSKNKRTGPAILEYDLISGSVRHLIDAIPGGPDMLIGSVDAAD
jgi:hypothetical protein